MILNKGGENGIVGFGGDGDMCLFLQGCVLGNLELNYFKIFTAKGMTLTKLLAIQNTEIPRHLN